MIAQAQPLEEMAQPVAAPGHDAAAQGPEGSCEEQDLAEKEKKEKEQKEMQDRAQQEKEAQEKAERERQARLQQEAQEKREQEARAQQQKQAEEKRQQEARAQQEKEAQLERERQARLQQEAHEKREQEARAQRQKQAEEKQQQEARAQQEKEAQLERERQARLQREAEEKQQQEARAQQEKEAQHMAEQERQAGLQQETKEKQQQEARAQQEKEALLQRQLDARKADLKAAESDITRLRVEQMAVIQQQAHQRHLAEQRAELEAARDTMLRPAGSSAPEDSVPATQVLEASPTPTSSYEDWSQDAQNPWGETRRQLFPSPAKEPEMPSMPLPQSVIPSKPPPMRPVPEEARSHAKQPAMAAHAAPPQPTKSALDKRIRRTMEPDAKGNYKVSREIREQWERDRDGVFKLFAQCGNCPDPCRH